ncbi:MAG: hypothetical protein J6036_06335 [Clostridia bacterium]|nr:hypothetical protein [Clostridia bacterium]
MKLTCKIFAIAFALIFVLSSCGTNETETVPEYGEIPAEAVNLNGAVVNWGWSSSGGITFGFMDGTSLADIAAERKKDVENAYNCTLNVIYADSDTNNAAVQTAALSGKSVYDISTNGSFAYCVNVRAGYFAGLSALIDVTDTDKWGTPNMLHHMIWKNDVYGVVPYAWPELLYTTFGYPIAVNETLINKYGHSDPREFVETEMWTWDKFEEVLHEYTVKESDRTVYGMATHAPYFSVMMFLSNGTAMSDVVDGSVCCGVFTERGYVALERAHSIYLETCRDCFHPSDAWGGVGVDLFVNGEIVLLTLPTSELFGDSSSLLYRTDNVGILPYPFGPDAEPGIYASDYSNLDCATVIPISANDLSVSALILDAVYEPFDEYKTKDDIITYMAEQVFFDERDAHIFANMLENTQYGYFREGGRGVIENACSSDTPVKQLIETNESRYGEIIEEYMVHHYEGIFAVYGSSGN